MTKSTLPDWIPVFTGMTGGSTGMTEDFMGMTKIFYIAKRTPSGGVRSVEESEKCMGQWERAG